MLTTFRSTGLPVAAGSALLDPVHAAAAHTAVVNFGPADVNTSIRHAVAGGNANDIAAVNRLDAFEQRFGIKGHLMRSEDMRKTLANPQSRLLLIEQEIEKMAYDLSVKYAEKYAEYKNIGFGELEAIQMADEFITALLNEELKTLQRKYPYSFSAENVAQELVERNKFLIPGTRFIK